MTTANITTSDLLAELKRGSEWSVNEYSIDAATELVSRGVAVIETRNVLFGRKHGGKEFSKTKVTVRLLSMKERLCHPVTVEESGELMAGDWLPRRFQRPYKPT